MFLIPGMNLRIDGGADINDTEIEKRLIPHDETSSDTSGTFIKKSVRPPGRKR